MNLFVTAIGTDCGKTITSAILCEALQADYWKPIQSGTVEIDRKTVQNLISNARTIFHPEQYLLQTPVSPHAAAEIDLVNVELNDFQLPSTKNHLIIEGAGGILVPLNYNGDFVIDLAARFETEIVLVSNNYLGSINHTLLTIEALKKRNLPIKGIIFNGEPNEATEKVILLHSGLGCLLRIGKEAFFTKELVSHYAKLLNL